MNMLGGHAPRESLAIVGIGCHFPGGARTPESYWRLLCSETDATRVVPETRWNTAKYYDPNPAKLGKMVTRRGGFLGEIDQFDAQFFGISPREANLLDPQQRLLLQTTWEALEDGGLPADALAGTDVGVFVGGFTLDYQLLQNQGRTSRYRFKTHSATGMMMTMLANRISFAFDFRGPSMTIDTACSSSLVAVHLAALSIWNGECELALAGGVNVMIGPNTAIAESKSGFLSPDGRCKAFDDSADGYARGEGAAVVVIKPLEQALRDGDEIYAEILGTAVSQDGRTDGITVPSADAQEAAITAALRRAGVHPGEVGYVEAHGTGTPVGDPIEVRALANALASHRPVADPLLIGSVKSNIGHLEAGAGVAGLIKTALVLKCGYIPATLHVEKLSSRIPFEDLNVDVARTGRPFPAGRRRLAGVNSFGFGGTNAHVVLAEPPTPVRVPAANGRPALPLAVLPVSARTPEALAARAQELASHLDAHPDLTLLDLGYTLSQRRFHLSHRRTVVAGSVSEAREQLRALADVVTNDTSRTPTGVRTLVYVCTGMGPQWWKMCRGLLDSDTAFTESILRCDRELSHYTNWSLVDELRADQSRSRMAETEVAQPANFAIQVALAAQLEQFGIRPDAVVGHSAGEVAAHYLSGVLTFEQAVQVVFHRSRLQQRASGLGRMLAVGADADSVFHALDDETRDEIGRRVSVAAVNGPSSLTLAGDGDVLDGLARQLDERRIFHRFLPGNVPYHTHHMDPLKDELCSALSTLSPAPATIPLYSTVTGEALDGHLAGAAYWWQNIRATVLFESAIRRLLDDGYTHFVELGPHPVLAASIAETAATQQTDVAVLASARRNEDDIRTLLDCVGELHCHGHRVAWDVLFPPQGARLAKLPVYPWQSRRYWNETQEAAEDLHYEPVHPLLGQPVGGVHSTWEVELSTAIIPFLADHRVQGSVVVPAAVFVEIALTAAEAAYGSTDHRVNDLRLHRALILDETCDPVLRTTLNRQTGAVEFSVLTATPASDPKWTLTATAELDTLSSPPGSDDAPSRTRPATTVSSDEFYARTLALGFDYGDAFRLVGSVTSGTGWATAELSIPPQIADDIDGYRFHPALIDGAFQTLFGAASFGDDTVGGPYLPTRVRRSAIYRSPEKAMTAHVRVTSVAADEIESDITITGDDGGLLAAFTGFTVQSLGASLRMSPERVDKSLYEVQWVAATDDPHDTRADADPPADSSWLVFLDAAGFGSALADQLRRGGHHVRTVTRHGGDTLAILDGGYALNPRHPQQFNEILQKHCGEDNLAGIVNCWPMDIPAHPDGEPLRPGATEAAERIGVLATLHMVKAMADLDTVRPRLFLITANAQPAPGTQTLAPERAAIWGLGRVIGHQEFAAQWGGLIDIDDADEVVESAARVCRHLVAASPEDQIAIRGGATFVPRLRACSSLTQPFPTKLAPDATYVISGGGGALGRIVATFLAERGARHIALLSRSETPPRHCWPSLAPDHPHASTIDTIRMIERLGARVSAAGVDVADADQVHGWLDRHNREEGRPVRGIIHAAGSLHDQLLVNMTEADFTTVLTPKIRGARVLHDALRGQELDFFVMFGSAGSVITSPGQGNYAAANAFLDAFAAYRQSEGLPALTIGWGPWSVGMVEELELEKSYAQRGIELITPAVGIRILDRLVNQKAANVVAISADWRQARRVAFGGHVPPMFSELGAADDASECADTDSSMRELLSAIAEEDRLDAVASHVRQIVAAVFELPVAEVGLDDSLDDIGLDSMMAMDFRLRINAAFAIDVPLLELLRGVSVASLAVQILADLRIAGDDAPEVTEKRSQPHVVAGDIDGFLEQLSEAELREVLAELEKHPHGPNAGGTP